MPPRRATDAFTLAELCIVIAVTGTLLALMIGGTRAVRRQADSATCAQRLRAVGAALFAYAGDHRGRIPPRALGLYREQGESRPAGNDIAWPNRLVNRGYADPNVFFCPSYTPTKNYLADPPLPQSGKTQTYGMRTWVIPGQAYVDNKSREEEKPLNAIVEPADFFLVADSFWLAWKSQGYGIAPGMGNEQFVHLRHSGKANALFADGHVEAKTGDYFRQLHLADRQAAYSGGGNLPFGVTDRLEF